jgi:hypothetical protein
MAGVDSTSGQPRGLADAWALLSAHPALTWVPPLWRDATEMDTGWAREQAVSAVERNLLVHIGVDGRGVMVRLGTGPLVDRNLGDGVDPVNPAARHDRRLDVEAPTFEDAVCALADRVVQILGPPDRPRSAAPGGTADPAGGGSR